MGLGVSFFILRREKKMVQHHRCHQVRKGEEGSSHAILVECGNATYKKTRPKLLLLFLSSFFFCTLVSAPRLLYFSTTLPFFHSFGGQVLEKYGLFMATAASKGLSSSSCSSLSNGGICCDRTGYRSDVCFMKGDIRTSSATSSVILYTSNNNSDDTVSEEEQRIEGIKPYTRKWERDIMDTIEELRLVTQGRDSDVISNCQVRHSVPAIFFSTGGYTGNVYHEFNDGILPLYITSKRFNRQVIFVILEYHNWWMSKYGDIVTHLSDYQPIDFTRDQAVHCFPEAIVGLQIHEELAVTPSLMPNNQTIQDFRVLLDETYKPRIRGLIREEESLGTVPPEYVEEAHKKPKLVILSRNGSRAMMNEREVVELAEEIGFQVQVLSPTRTTELAKIYRALNTSDVMVGVHGAAMTHFLFMRPGTVFIQVVPLGTNWAARTYYGDPAIKLGLKYIAYEILTRESSLYEEYEEDDPVLRNPKSVTRKGWQWTKRVYLDGQNVKLDLTRFRKRLIYAYVHSKAQRRLRQQHQ